MSFATLRTYVLPPPLFSIRSFRLIPFLRSLSRSQLTAVYWCARQFGIPLKTTSSPHGLFTPQELYLILSAFFISVFMGFSLADNFKLRNAAKSAAPALLGVLRLRISQVKGVPVRLLLLLLFPTLSATDEDAPTPQARLEHLARHVQDVLVGKNVEGIVQGETSRAYYTRLLANAGGRSTEELESSVQSTMTASVSNQGQGASLPSSLFFKDELNVSFVRCSRCSSHQLLPRGHKQGAQGQPRRPLQARHSRSRREDPRSSISYFSSFIPAHPPPLPQSLVNEAMRLDPQVPLIPRVALEDTTIVDGDKTIEVKRGEGVYPSMKAAGIVCLYSSPSSSPSLR